MIELIGDTDLTNLGGMVGALSMFDVTPRVNPARIRPFIWAVLLLRGAVRIEEIISSIAPHCHPDDLRSWEEDSDSPTLEEITRSTIDELINQKILRESEHPGLYVLAATPEAARVAISSASTLNAQLPDHMLAEMGRIYSTSRT